MKKKIALLSAIGVAGGLLYALESQHRRNRGGKKVTPANLSDGQSAANYGENGDGRARSALENENAQAMFDKDSEHTIDDHGTGQSEASQILRNIRDKAFAASDEKLALALGRPTEEIQEWTSGNGWIDGDVLMKVRTLAMQRGFEV